MSKTTTKTERQKRITLRRLARQYNKMVQGAIVNVYDGNQAERTGYVLNTDIDKFGYTVNVIIQLYDDTLTVPIDNIKEIRKIIR